MNLGPHAFYILAAYAATALIMGGLVLRAVLDHHAQLRALAELEGRGVRRRSDSLDAAFVPSRDNAETGAATRPSGETA